MAAAIVASLGLPPEVGEDAIGELADRIDMIVGPAGDDEALSIRAEKLLDFLRSRGNSLFYESHPDGWATVDPDLLAHAASWPTTNAFRDKLKWPRD